MSIYISRFLFYNDVYVSNSMYLHKEALKALPVALLQRTLTSRATAAGRF